MFVLFSICFIIVYNFFSFENEKRSKHFLKTYFFINFSNKIVFQIPVKMSESENEYGGKETSDEAKVEYKKDPVTG